MTKSVAQQIREMGNRLAAIHEADDCMDKTKTNESVVIEATNDAYAALAKTAYPNAQTIVKIATVTVVF